MLYNGFRLPPILGEIDHLSVKIIYELKDKLDTIHYCIKDFKKSSESLRDSNNPSKGYMVYNEPVGTSTAIITFKNPGTYEIFWYINQKLSYQHTVTTGPLKHLIFVSCDLVEADTKHSLWQEIGRNLVPNTGIIHIGDQAYMDAAFNKCLKTYSHLKLENNNVVEIKNKFRRYCFDQYSKRYIDTWLPHIDVLSHAANYYLWDDHEIKNDIRLCDEFTPIMKMIVEAAEYAYQSYQESFHLRESYVLSAYSWYKYLDSNTFMLAIERTSQDITLDEIFETLMYFDCYHNYDRLILCFSSAPIPQPHGYYGDLYKKLVGVGKFWNNAKLRLLYERLFDLNKDIVLIGGDLHLGLVGKIFRDEQEIQVIIASPITNQPDPMRYLAAKGLRGTHLIGDDIKFITLASKARRCYAQLDLESFCTKMTWSEDIRPKNWTRYYKMLSKF